MIDETATQQTDPSIEQGKSMADVFWPDSANAGSETKQATADEMFGNGHDAETLQQDGSGYDAFSLPQDMEIDHEVLTAFRPIAADLGLDQAQAQSLVDFYAAQVQGMSSRMDEASVLDQNAYINQTRHEWASAARRDEEIGGVRHQQAVSVAQNALRQVATPDLVSILAETGLGDHPEIIRLFYRIGTRIGEDPVMSGGRGHASASLADLFYGSHG